MPGSWCWTRVLCTSLPPPSSNFASSKMPLVLSAGPISRSSLCPFRTLQHGTPGLIADEVLDWLVESLPFGEPCVQEGEVYSVKVVKLVDYGAFVELPNGFQALLHISEISHDRVRPTSYSTLCV